LKNIYLKITNFMKVNNKVDISFSDKIFFFGLYEMTNGVLRNSNLHSLMCIMVFCISLYQAILAWLYKILKFFFSCYYHNSLILFFSQHFLVRYFKVSFVFFLAGRLHSWYGCAFHCRVENGNIKDFTV
jgi:hypothetical protein